MAFAIAKRRTIRISQVTFYVRSSFVEVIAAQRQERNLPYCQISWLNGNLF